MTVKIILTILGIANGIFMTMDGFHVVLKGKYIGPEKPGPWARIFYKLKINVFKLGPLFMIVGVGWLFWIYALWTNQDWAYIFGLIISSLTVWYLKVGTFIAVVTVLLVMVFKEQLGF